MAEQGFDKADDGTVYWTLSFYITAKDLGRAISRRGSEDEDPLVVGVEDWRRLALEDDCSLILGDAMDPLFNDISDRDVQGQAEDFLLSACDRAFEGLAEDGSDEERWRAAQEAVLDEKEVIFDPPSSVEWKTEGRIFRAQPEGMDERRSMKLKRFWFAHRGGGLSYHLSFIFNYKKTEGYTPKTYYFLSMLQKLAAPKELSISPGKRRRIPDGKIFVHSIFEETGIRLLDNYKVYGLAPAVVAPGEESSSGNDFRFWKGVEKRFNFDARCLLRRLCMLSPEGFTCPDRSEELHKLLLPDQHVIEVPGLGMPRCRVMFLFDDERFFNRLMPRQFDGEPLPLRKTVQQQCYQPYLEKMAKLEGRQRESNSDAVVLDGEYWEWVRNREDYNFDALFNNGEIRLIPDESHGNPPSPEQWAAAIRAGRCEVRSNGEFRNLCIPSFDIGRPDCFDYLFLAGFNQNIIDFMNQDASEILDSTDPLYPDTTDQADERFFVRFANHRALITYVNGSRSLEVANDYIGTCPYAFLIHVLAMHNEYLDRTHEVATANRLDEIERGMNGGSTGKWQLSSVALRAVEYQINHAKLAHFKEYLKHRYTNPFRYDTERVVFEKLGDLRGTSRKQEALLVALKNIEDHAADIARQVREQGEEEQSKYQSRVSIGFAVIGLSSIIQLVYSIAVFRIELQINNVNAESPISSIGRWNIAWWSEVAAVPFLVFAIAILTFLSLMTFFGFMKFLHAIWKRRDGRSGSKE